MTVPLRIVGVVDLKVRDEFDVSRARVLVAKMAADIGMNRSKAYRLATAVSELGTNLVFHAHHGGTLRFQQIHQNGRWGIEVQADDTGPGIADIDLAMQDGYSTSGSLGSGLPGCRRLVDEFHLESQVEMGTHVVIRLWN